MKVNDVTKWIEVDHQASSLYDVILNGTFKYTKAGKDKWRSLIHNSALQENCNEEGFNLNSHGIKMRIGLFANNENDCKTPDSSIGFGFSVSRNIERKITSCGSLLLYPIEYIHIIAAFGFILIK